MKNLTIEKFEDYLRSKNLKDTTIENYTYCFHSFMQFGTFNQLTINKLLSKKSNTGNIRAFLVNLKKYLLINYEELDISQDLKLIITEVDIPNLSGRKRKRLIKPLLKEHIDILEKYLETEQLKIQLLISYYCGLRLGELIKIKILSFNWEVWKKDQSKMGECIVFGKGDKEGIALVPSFVMKRVATFIRNKQFKSLNDRIFITSKDVKISNRGRSWQIKLREAGIKSGLTKFDENKKVIIDTAVHPHRLRHSWGYHILTNKGLNMREVQEILRHSSITSTQIYTYVNKEDLKKKLSES